MSQAKYKKLKMHLIFFLPQEVSCLNHAEASIFFLSVLVTVTIDVKKVENQKVAQCLFKKSFFKRTKM